MQRSQIRPHRRGRTGAAQGMHRNPSMKLMFGMGYYDMLTTIGWVHYYVNHCGISQDRIFQHYYEAGHMPYLSDSAAMKLEEDIKNFILA